MNAIEARLKLDEATKTPLMDELFDLYINQAIKSKENQVDIITPFRNTVENKNRVKDYLTSNGFKDINIERFCVSGGNDPNDPIPTVYNLKVSFIF